MTFKFANLNIDSDIAIDFIHVDYENRVLIIDCVGEWKGTIATTIGERYPQTYHTRNCRFGISEIKFDIVFTGIEPFLTNEAVESYKVFYGVSDLYEIESSDREDFFTNIEEFEWDEEKIKDIINTIDLIGYEVELEDVESDSFNTPVYKYLSYNDEYTHELSDCYCDIEMEIMDESLRNYFRNIENEEYMIYDAYFNGDCIDSFYSENRAIRHIENLIDNYIDNHVSVDNLDFDECYVQPEMRYLYDAESDDWDYDSDGGTSWTADKEDYISEEYITFFNGEILDYYDLEGDAISDLVDRIEEYIEDERYEDIDFEECYVMKVTNGNIDAPEMFWRADESEYKPNILYKIWFNGEEQDEIYYNEDRAIEDLQELVEDQIDDEGIESLDFVGCYVTKKEDSHTDIVYSVDPNDYIEEQSDNDLNNKKY